MRRAFTIVELLIGACLLVIILGLAISLSRQVRSESARLLTADLLARLDRQAVEYSKAHDGQFPAVTPVIPPDWTINEVGLTDRANPSSKTKLVSSSNLRELEVLRRAVLNNHEFVTAFVSTKAIDDLRQLPPTVFDSGTMSLRDAWGTPVAFLPGQQPLIGMAPRNAFFFVSAGPDRNFLTLGDNLYSYEAFRRR